MKQEGHTWNYICQKRYQVVFQAVHTTCSGTWPSSVCDTIKQKQVPCSQSLTCLLGPLTLIWKDACFYALWTFPY